jgi:cardiolipin synthase A/B
MSWYLLFLFALSASEWIIRIIMVAVILRRRFAPSTALAWLVLVMLLPELGLLVYLLIGVNHLGRRRAHSHRLAVAQARASQDPDCLAQHATRPQIDPQQRNMILQAERISGNPIVAGNDVELIPDADTLCQRLTQDIDAAQHHAHLLYYIFAPDDIGQRIGDALIRAKNRGVQCRLLADAVGSRPLFRSQLYRELLANGIEVHDMLPASPWRRKLARIDLRNHRKIAVIDGTTAYAGSHNAVNENYGHKHAGKWIDLSGRFTGPVVAQFQQLFCEDWAFDTDQTLHDNGKLFPHIQPVGEMAAQLVPTGPNHEGESFRRVLIAALAAAQRHIIMTTPYLVLDEPTMLALAMASDRGVRVDLIVPKKSDHPIVAAAGRYYYQTLLQAGIHIHTYNAGMLHAKTITVDDAFALLGSANLDVRSFYLNFEANVLLYGKQITQHLRFAQQHYLNDCDSITLSAWRKRPLIKQYAEGVASLFSPLL